VVPMKFQYEQQCNAFALEQLGLPVIWGHDKNWLPILQKWVSDPQEYQFDFPDETAEVIDKVVKQFAR
ncbi:MAG TPA: glycosyl transferase, partial [Pedobacter sp.]